MENAVDALKLGFAVIVFTMALSLTMYMFSKATATAKAVFHKSDITEFIEYEQVTEENIDRVVGLETIIPTLYKYYKEDYTVIFRNNNGTFMKLYESDPNKWDANVKNKYYGEQDQKVCSFDIDEEAKRNDNWADRKAMLDNFLYGGIYENIDFGRGFLNQYANKKFKENLGEYEYTTNSGKTKRKRVIIYTLQN